MTRIRAFLTRLISNPVLQGAVFLWLFIGAGHFNGALVQILTFVLVSILFAQSINILTGMAGQISLGHAAFFGVGAYGTAILAKMYGLSLLLTIPLASIFSAALAYVLSFPAGRVREVYLAMMTLGFGQIFLEVAREWTSLTGGVMGLSGVPAAGLGTLSMLDFQITSVNYFRALLFLTAGALMFIRNLEQSRIGRAFYAIHHSELAAGSVGIARRQTRQLAYALSGLLAGLAGSFYAHLVGYLGPDSFTITRSIEVLVVAIVGGLGSSAGQVMSALFFTFLPEKLQLFAEYQFIAYGAILTFTLLLFPKGIGGLLFAPSRFIRSKLLSQTARSGSAQQAASPQVEGYSVQHLSSNEAKSLSIQNISMNFGGLTALDNVSLDLQPGKIMALVGPNGSGKSTLVNVISGIYRPSAGRILMGGRDVTGLPDYKMARAGVVRTFQDPRLVPHFTVRENMLLGAHGDMNFSWLASGLSLPRAVQAEKDALQHCDAVLEFLQLHDVADQPVASLPYGHRRMTELGRMLLARPGTILLDEPAAGLSDLEMERLASVIVRLKELGLTIMLIEHHMDFLTDLVDDVVVLDSGKIIYRGDMDGMRKDADVIAAYLGDEGTEYA